MGSCNCRGGPGCCCAPRVVVIGEPSYVDAIRTAVQERFVVPVAKVWQSDRSPTAAAGVDFPPRLPNRAQRRAKRR